jgi:hypothetical protein
MIYGSHSPYHTQEHWPSTCWSAGTSKCAAAPGVTTQRTQYASQEEEPFEIELVVPESPTAQGSHAEEEQQPKGHDVEDRSDEEPSPLSDIEDEKMY